MDARFAGPAYLMVGVVAVPIIVEICWVQHFCGWVDARFAGPTYLSRVWILLGPANAWRDNHEICWIQHMCWWPGDEMDICWVQHFLLMCGN